MTQCGCTQRDPGRFFTAPPTSPVLQQTGVIVEDVVVVHKDLLVHGQSWALGQSIASLERRDKWLCARARM